MIEYSDSYSDTSGSVCQFKRDKVPNNNNNLATDNSQLVFPLVGKTTDAVNNANSSVKKHKHFCSIKVTKQLLEIVRNPINQFQYSSWIKSDWRLVLI